MGCGRRGLIFFMMLYDGLSGNLYFSYSVLIHAFTHCKMLVGTDLSKSNPRLWPENKAHITFNFNLDFFTSESIKSTRLLGDWEQQINGQWFRNVFGSNYMDDIAENSRMTLRMMIRGYTARMWDEQKPFSRLCIIVGFGIGSTELTLDNRCLLTLRF